MNAVDSSPHFPKEGKARDDSKWRPREHKPLRSYDENKKEKKDQLEAVGVKPLTDEELVGARLYTGPMCASAPLEHPLSELNLACV